MENPLLKFTNDTYEKIGARILTLRSMSLDDLKDYQTGLGRYKPNQHGELSNVREQINRKEAKRKSFTPSQKSITQYIDQQVSKQQSQLPSRFSLRSLLEEFIPSLKFFNHKSGQRQYSQLPFDDAQQNVNFQGQNLFNRLQISENFNQYLKTD